VARVRRTPSCTASRIARSSWWLFMSQSFLSFVLR